MGLINFSILLLCSITFSQTRQKVPSTELAPVSQVRIFNGSDPETCSTKTVDTTNMPDNRSQDDLYWCHAYATADLFSFYAKKKISAYAIAAQSYQFQELQKTIPSKQLTEWGSFPINNFYAIAKSQTNFCAESNFPEANDESIQFGKVFKKLENLYNDQFSRSCLKHYNNLANGIDEANLKAINKLSGSGFVTALINQKCVDQIPIPMGTMTSHHFDTVWSCLYTNTVGGGPDVGCTKSGRTDITENLNWELLDAKLSDEEPVSIEYDASVLTSRPGKINKNTNHSSLIIGRKFNKETNECEYLLRNSWGSSCEYYAKEYKDKCSNGNIWVPRQYLQKSTESFNLFTPAN